MDFMEHLKNETNYTKTHNGAVAYKSTLDSVVDLFAQIGAMRNRNAKDKCVLFENAFAVDRELAMKTLFYNRDCRGGQGERQTFRDIFIHLVNLDTQVAIDNINNIVEFGRWDDLIDIAYKCENSKFTENAIKYIKNMLDLDLVCESHTSLLGKWLPSINASNKETIAKGKWIANKLGYSPKKYRKLLSYLRNKIRIIENNLREKDYSEIKYEQVPSLAMNKYRGAFYRNDEEKFNKYLEDVKSGKKEIKASTLYPYDIVRSYLQEHKINNVLEEQWKALPDYLSGAECKSLVVADVSGSMYGFPINVSVSLALYLSERMKGVYANKFITFDTNPKLIEINPKTSLCAKIEKVYNADWGGSTNIEKVFDLILKIAVDNDLQQSDLPEQVIVITDMNFDMGTYRDRNKKKLFKNIKNKFKQNGYELPKLIWWNANAINEVFPMKADENCQYVSGASPSIMKAVIEGKMLSAIDLLKSAVLIERYKNIKF